MLRLFHHTSEHEHNIIHVVHESTWKPTEDVISQCTRMSRRWGERRKEGCNQLVMLATRRNKFRTETGGQPFGLVASSGP